MAKKNHELTPAFELFNKSLEIVKRNMNVFLILYALPFLQALASTASHRHKRSFSPPSSFPGGPAIALLGVGMILFLAAVVLYAFLQTMTYGLELKGAKGGTPRLKELFELAKKYWLRLIGLALIVGGIIAVGLILLIIPGLIMIRRYLLAPYVMIDQDLSIEKAMRKSADLTKEHSGSIWSIMGVLFLILVIGFIPVFGQLLSFGLGAIYGFAPAIRYFELKKLS